MVAANEYQVVVQGSGGAGVETEHKVHMAQEYYRELCGGTVTHEYVLVQSFRFLLEREPNTAILREFDLREIGHYFPEFEADMKVRLNP